MASVARDVGVCGWAYNRDNFKYDQQLRWQRFITGRKMAITQVDMFRQDVSDLAGVSIGKLKIYSPIYGIVVTVCVTVLVQGRSGLKFPGPPIFISAIYLQCLGIGMGFMALATWMLFHAAMRAQIACVQLRTCKVRVPVPTQRQLDGSRKLLSTWEEQELYNMFRIPFAMPNGAAALDVPPEGDKGTARQAKSSRGGLPAMVSKAKAKLQQVHEEGTATRNARVPGFTSGHPSWYEQELEECETAPGDSASSHGRNGPPQPYEHFELLRKAQLEWWGSEAYMRVCFLYSMMHLVLACSYWIAIHNIAELGMVWCAMLGAAGLNACVWIIFRLDVLPEYGGCFPFEMGGPFVASIALKMMYSQAITQTMLDVARGVEILIILMHIQMTFRLYAVAKPTNGKVRNSALESGGRLFNASGSCDAPCWLPSAFQHVAYLVAPPKTEEQLARQREPEDEAAAEERLAKADMTPWYYVRTMIFVVGLGWSVQLAGRIVECVNGERMLMSNPGAPPWSRTGQWYGWEHGPVSSKHYAHVTPQRGHWAYQRGWGPNGQQEFWVSDMFGLHPEADMWWAEDLGPEPRVGAAGVGENTWSMGPAAYGQLEPQWGAEREDQHDWADSGGHRRLRARGAPGAFGTPSARPLVPLPVNWPAALEPGLLACGSAGLVAAVDAAGSGAVVPSSAAAGEAPGAATAFVLEGLLELGLARSVT